MRNLTGGVLFFALILLSSCKYSDQRIKREIGEKEDRKNAYVLGYSYGEQIKKSAKEWHKQSFLRGLRRSLQDKASFFPEEQEAAVLRCKTEVKLKPQVKEGKTFLKANKQKPGVKVTSSGLQYKELKAGAGRSPSASDRVEVHYRGTLVNGEEFDSSYKRGKSVTFPLNGVIKGWTEGLQLMKEGAEYEFYIPPKLGYGSSGSGSIPPDSVLIFKVELIKVL